MSVPIGCYRDDNDRDLPYLAYEDDVDRGKCPASSRLTPANCTATCYSQGYTYAGTAVFACYIIL